MNFTLSLRQEIDKIFSSLQTRRVENSVVEDMSERERPNQETLSFSGRIRRCQDPQKQYAVIRARMGGGMLPVSVVRGKPEYNWGSCTEPEGLAEVMSGSKMRSNQGFEIQGLGMQTGMQDQTPGKPYRQEVLTD